MILIEELSSLLGILYAAPLDREKWQVFLDRLCALTETACGYMVSIRPDEGNVLLGGGGLNFNPDILQLYNEHYGAKDPYITPVTSNPRIGIIQAEELLPHADLIQSELYNDLLRRYDLEFMTVVSSDKFTGEGDFFPLWRSPKQGPMNSDSIHLLEMLLPHIQTALRLRTKVRGCDESELFSETALNSMSIATLLVSGNGRVRQMNQNAAVCLQSGDGLLLQDGKLTANDLYERAQLESLISAAASGGNRSEGALGGAIKISRVRAPDTLHVTVIPTPQESQISASGSSALIFVNDPSSLPRPRGTLLRQLYGLTPSEARVADLLLEGSEVREAAERLGITLETCRFHIKRVLAKTGTRRQAELIRLMLSLPGQ